MTAGKDSFVEYVKEQLAPIRELASGRFFGGTRLTAGGTQFAMMMGSSLYFVVDDSTRAQYLEMGSRHFTYKTPKKTIEVKKYFEVPADLLEDPDRLLQLARGAVEAARRLQASPKKRAARAKKILRAR